MSAQTLLEVLRRRGIELRAEGETLRFSAPRGVMTPELRREVAEHKRELLALLQDGRSAVSRESAPLSYAQLRLWFLDRLHPGTAAYNAPSVLRLAGPLEPAALAMALGEVVRRHEVLRTTFPEVDGEPVAAVAAAREARLPLVDLRGLREPLARAAAALARAEAGRPFDLACGPLLRATLLRLSGAEHHLLLTLHHIVADGWSMGVLVHELQVLYEAFREGRRSPLPELPIQYADFARWQRRRIEAGELTGELDYWRRQLAGAPTLLELPADRPRPATPSLRGGSEPFHLPSGIAAGMAALARRLSATPFTALLAAFAALLHRYSGRDDLLVGTAVSNRVRLETEGLIGGFANLLPLRADLSGDPTFAVSIERMRAVVAGAQAHQELPFERLVEELAPEGARGHNPLLQAVLLLHQHPRNIGASQLAIEPLPAGTGTARFDLELALTQSGPELAGALDYSADLFDTTTIRRWLGHFVTLLAGAVERPDLSLSELPLLTPPERQQLEVEWYGDAVPLPAELTLGELFALQARRTPEAVALVFGAERMTYGELDRRSDRLAGRLRSLGVGPEVRVGISAERGPALVEGILAILKAGGAYVPLDPASPPGRLGWLLQDSGVAVLLAEDELGERFAGAPARFLSLEEGVECPREPGPPGSGASPDNLAYVIYTSGSTGRPKGVAVSHRNVLRLFAAARRWLDFHEEDVWTLFHSCAFDFSVWELWGALLHGGRLVVVPYWVSRSPEAFYDLLAAERVTVLNQTPSAFRQLARVEEARGGPGDLALHTVIFGGEALEIGSLGPWIERHGDRRPRLLNMYGITETTVHVTCRPLVAADLDAGRRGSPVGQPLPDLRVHVVDRHLRPLPLGVPGELAVGGAGLARGYLGRSDLTAERFVPDPFGAPGERLYRSGDLGRQRPDSEIEHLGRIDHQVKLRGFRVEPGEIEAVLAHHPGVAECAVLARETGGEHRLVAYVAPRGAAPASAELRAFLAGQLPDYMVPSSFLTLPALPLTANGKLDRDALPPLPEERPATAGYEPPSTPIQELLCEIFAELLGLDRAGIRDDFFELGGHSLLAARLAARVREALGVELPVRRIFDLPTAADLARELAPALGGAAAAPPPGPVPHGGRIPLSFAQERLWFLGRLETRDTFLNISTAQSLTGALSVPALEQAFHQVLRRHEILRTTFPTVEGEAAQVVMPFLPRPFPRVDLEALPFPERESAAFELASAEARRPFDLAAGPLLRVVLLRLAGDEHRLLMTVHHIVADGWSLGLLTRELLLSYEAALRGEPSPLPEPRLQYADFAIWQRLAGEALARDQLAYWKQRLAGAPPVLELPTDRPRPPLQTFRGARRSLDLPPGLAAGLRKVGRRQGATLFMTLLAAFAALLHRMSGQSDLSIGSPASGRSRIELEDLIGPFLNNLVLRVDLAGAPRPGELLRRVREVALGAYAHQDLPFGRLVAELRPRRELSHHPLFQVMLILQPPPPPAPVPAGLTVRSLAVDSGAVQLDLTLYAEEEGADLRGALEHNSDLFDPPTADRMAGHWRNLLIALAGGLDEPLSAWPLLSAAERHQLLEEWNDTADPGAGETCLPRQIEERARRSPEAVALVCRDRRLTYRELDGEANRLARRLRRLGLGPEVRVAVHLDRSPEMVIALLAVLKAGGTYIPLAPGFPRERLAFILEETRAPVVLTRESLAALGPALERESAEPLGLDPAPEQAAYVLYTSGSTGRPKGVQVTHGALANFFDSMRRRPGMSPSDALLAVTTISFDIAALELFLPLLSGARVVLAGREEAADGERLAALLAGSGITVLQATPATWQLLLESGWPGDRRLTALCGGEALPRPLADALLARSAALWNLYGPTETTIWSTLLPVELRSNPAGAVPIGRPIANTRVYLLDVDLEPVPIGVRGMLHIGGRGLARGYFSRPGQTAEAFVPDPFASEPGARMYRTGDLARLLAGGILEFLGRADDQMKVRGHRIEPAEIEAALRAHPAVRQAAVALREDTAGRKALVSYLVADPERPPVAGDLRRFLQDRLPASMIPAGYVLLDALPLTPNGKVDRRRLPAWEPGPPADRDGAAPRDPVEAALAAVWAEILGLEQVGIHDSFFELGGDSILGVRMIARARKAGLELTPRQLFQEQTIARLASVANPASAAASPSFAEAGPGQEDLYPLSPMQEGMLFHSVQAPASGVYVQQLVCTLTGELDATVLERAWGTVLDWHPALRTSFHWTEAEAPLQRVHHGVEAAIERLDWRGLAERDLEARLEAFLQAHRREGFDLTRPPLMRLAVIRMDDLVHRFVWSHHHLLLDGWSLPTVLRDLGRSYEALRQDREPQREPARPYRDYIAWLQRQSLAPAAELWRRTLAGFLRPTPLPGARPAAAPDASDGAGAADWQERLPLETTAALRALARRGSLTFNTLLQGAWALLLSRTSSEDDVVFGAVVSGRPADLEGAESIVGLLINTLPVRARVRPEAELLPWLRDLQARQAEAQQHQHSPLVQVQGWSEVPAGTPLFESILVFENFPIQAALSGLEGSLRVSDVRIVAGSNYPLTLMAIPEADLTLRISYARERFTAAAVRRILVQLAALLEELAAAPPGRRLAELSGLPEPERHQILVEWSSTWHIDAEEATLHQLFEEQAERFPDAVALFHGEGRTTWRDLERRANQLAHHLRRRGVGPEVRVGVLAERSPELVAALLGVLKAGGAYVPLDPSYTASRLAFLLEDSRVAVLLAQERLLPALPPFDNLICLDRDRPEIERESPERPGDWVHPDCPAYAIYTSGSTGLPKAVLGLHRGAVNRCRWMWQTFPFAAGEVGCQKTALGFVDSVWEIFGPLLQGVPQVVIPEATLRDLSALVATLAAHRVTRIVLVPSLLRALFEVEDLAARLPDLAFWVSSGEPLPAELCARFRERLPGRRLLNLYGSSEVAADVTWEDVAWEEIKTGELPSSVPIGRPIANTWLYLLDPLQRPVPAGAPGEVCVGGESLARGYLDRPSLTALKFVPDPFAAQPGDRLYRTGDLARHLADGRIELLGRIDAQVKIRGVRVELGEIEARLRRHPEVEQAVAAAREDTPGEVRLVAYVVPRADAPGLSGRLLAAFGQQLPAPLVPSACILLSSLPLTPSGKVDRTRLPAPEKTGGAEREIPAAPRDALELTLLTLWERLFDARPIGVHHSFFDLGGNSLLAMRLMVELRQRLGFEVALPTLMETPTLEALAARLRRQPGGPAASVLVKIQPQGSRPPLVCVHPAGGEVLCYRALAEHLGRDQPLYALQAPGLDGGEPAGSMDEMVGRHLGELRAALPEGPWLLAGWSFGGIVAFEMARRLEEEGRPVGLLALIDAWAPGTARSRMEYDDATVLDWFLRELLAPFGAQGNGHLDALRPLGLEEQLRYVLAQAENAGALLPGAGTGFLRRRLAVYRASREALRLYAPQVHPGAVDLFRGEEQGEGDEGWDLGWSALAAGGVDVCPVPGDHLTLMSEPHVRTLADRLSARLERIAGSEAAT